MYRKPIINRRGNQEPRILSQIPFDASALTDTLTFSLSAIFCRSLIVVSVGKIKLVNFVTLLDLLGIKEKFVLDLTVLAVLYSPDTEINEAEG